MLPVLALAFLLGACDESAGTPLVVIARQTAAAAAEASAVAEVVVKAEGLDIVTASIGDAELMLEVAAAPEERQQGLSGRLGLELDAGMLFYFPSGSATGLWMNEMLFDLDFIWIGVDCTVVDLHENVPSPSGPDDALPIYRPDGEAATVIEVAAGSVRTAGIARGDEVRFGPSRSGTSYGCDG